jgi:predicted porin
LALAGGYETHEGFRPGAAGGNPNPKDTAVQFGIKFSFGPGQVGVGYETLDYGANLGNNGIKVPAMVVNGRFNLGPGALWAGLSKTSGGKDCTGSGTMGSAACGSAGEAKMSTIGYDYVMSKRTKMYVAYNKIDNGTGTNYYYIAGPAGNSNNGTTGGIERGTDVTTIALGIQHTF